MRAILAALIVSLTAPMFAQADLVVNLSGSTSPDFANQLNDANLLVARYNLQATGGDVQVDDVTIHFNNETIADETFSAVRLYFDGDGNGTLSGAEQIDTDQTPNGIDDFLTFSGSFTSVSGLSRDLYLQVDIANDPASYGAQFVFRVDGAGSLTLNNAGDTVSGSLPATSNTLSIRHSENQIVPGTGNPAGAQEHFFGQNNRPALHFIVSSLTPTPPGQLSGIDLNSITVTVTVGNVSDIDIVEGLTLWQDDGDSSFEPGSGEVLIQARSPGSVGSWNVSGSVINVTFSGSEVQLLSDIPTGSAKPLWVGIDFANDPEAVIEVSATRTNIVGALGVDADFFVTTTPTVSGGIITVTNRPPKEKPLEAQGEGGCSTGESNGLWLATTLLGLLGVGVWRRAVNFQD